MPQAVLAYCTFPDKAQAEEIAAVVVREKLAACANVFAAISSIYSWQGRLETAQEIPVFFKTTDLKFKMLKERIRTMHPSTTPCLISVPISDGLPDFLKWIAAETI